LGGRGGVAGAAFWGRGRGVIKTRSNITIKGRGGWVGGGQAAVAWRLRQVVWSVGGIQKGKRGSRRGEWRGVVGGGI